MEKIHSWEKLDSSIPGSGFASQWKSIETSFGLEERENEREKQREKQKERESSIVSRSLPKCRYSRLVQRCLVLFAISVHSVKRGRSIHETASRHFPNSWFHDTSREISVFFISSRNNHHFAPFPLVFPLFFHFVSSEIIIFSFLSFFLFF